MRAASADAPSGNPGNGPLSSGKLRVLAAAAVLAVVLVTSGCGNPLDGSDGLGDPYLPKAGNGGYDALHYDLDLTVDPASGHVDGSATIAARATRDLASFNLDFNWAGEVVSVNVDGHAADFDEDDGELEVICPHVLSDQDEFTVSVTYNGVPKPVRDAGSFSVGWEHRGDLVFTLDEPEGASTWFPVNDYPTDKATYTVRVTVPKPFVAASNGVLTAIEDKGTDQTFVWEMKQPQASYLASVTIADYEVETSESPNGVPIRDYFDPSLAADAQLAFARTGEVLDYFAGIFGAYPFEAYGVAVPSTDTGGAMENQTLSLYGQDVLDHRMLGDATTRELYLAHELAHQWFGDSVTIERWKDIWLNEGFATYASWLWLEHAQGAPAMASLVRESVETLSGQRFPPLSDPGADGLFSDNVYDRGGLTLHALRLTVGDQAFFTILKEWATRYKYGSVTTEEFVSLVKEVATNVPGDQITALFDSWLNQTPLPALPGAGS